MMDVRQTRKLALGILILAGVFTWSAAVPAAQQRGPAGGGPPVPGFRVGPSIYQQNCGTCHGTNAKQIDGKTAASISTLQELSPERVYEVLTTGSMQAQAAALSDVQKRQLGEFLAARPMGSANSGDAQKMTNVCTSNPAMTDPAAGASWNGWGSGIRNARFQTAASAGITAA